MFDPHDKATLALRATLQREAMTLIARVGQGFRQRTGQEPTQLNWHPVSNVSLPQVAEAERVMEMTLPADVVACYEACSGTMETCGWHWWPLHEVALKFRLMNTIAFGLRQGESGWFGPKAHFTADGTVSADAWNRGWIPIAESCGTPYGYFLCVDTAPGPEGQWGQLIEVMDPRQKLALGQPIQPARRIARGLLAYWTQLALVLEAEPMPPAIALWLEDPRQRRLQADLISLAQTPEPESQALRELRALQQARLSDPEFGKPPSEPEFDLTMLVAPPAARAARRKGRKVQRRTVWVTRVRFGSEHIGGASSMSGESARAEHWLHCWAHADKSAFGFLVGWYGDGKTDLLMGLVERLTRRCRRDANAPIPLYVDLAELADHPNEHAPATLSEALGAELARRRLPDARRALMQAVSDGRCVLILDHPEAVAPYHESVWEWAQQLPPASPGLAFRKARVMMVCQQEFFTDGEHLRRAALKLWGARINAEEAVHSLSLAEVDTQTQRAWLAPFALDAEHTRNAAWESLQYGSRGLAARIKALSPLFAETTSPSWTDVHAAWWRSCLPVDLALGDGAMTDHATILDLLQALNADHSGITPAQHASIIQVQWPDATPVKATRLGVASRIALRLHEHNGHYQLHDARRWLARAGVIALEEGALGSVVELLEGPSTAALVRVTVEAWFEKGHARPPEHIAHWLRTQYPPGAAGVLFQLGCEMARRFAVSQARSLARHGVAAKAFSEYIREAVELALPFPLSEARLAGAHLGSADFSHMVLQDVDLSSADLRRANFQEAELVRVRLDGACADGANFDRSRLVDVEAQGISARATSWLQARWNRRWPDADVTNAKLSVPGVSPQTSDSELKLQPSADAAGWPITRLVCSPDGRWLAAIGAERTIGLWQADTLSPTWHVALPQGPMGEVRDLCFSHDSRHLYSSHADSTVRVWHAETGEPTAESPCVAHHTVQGLVRCEDASHLIGLTDHPRAIWFNEGPPLKSENGTPSWLVGPLIHAMVERHQGQRFIASVSRLNSGSVVEFDRRASPQPRRDIAWHMPGVNRLAVAWSETAGHEWLACASPGGVWVGDPDASQSQWHISHPQDHDSAKRIELAFSPEGRWLVCVGAGRAALALDTHTGTVHPLNAEASAEATCVSFADNGRLILGGARLTHCTLPLV